MYRKRALLALVAIFIMTASCQQPSKDESSEKLTTPASQPDTQKQSQETGDEADKRYLDSELPAAERAEDLLSRMTLAEKIGQMTLVQNYSIDRDDIGPLTIGALLSGGGGYPRDNTPEGWVRMVDGFQAEALESRLSIPILYGVDSVHGHSNLRGSVIFPHNIGLGAAGDPALVERIARATALETAATGVYWNFAPVLAVPQDIRWGRTYEGYGENTQLVASLGRAYIYGLQKDDLSGRATILATPKHFVGDGGTTWGTSSTREFIIDQGVTQVDEDTLRSVHLVPYIDAIDAGAKSIMVSFSSWNETKMHGHDYLISDVLKDELGFSGFVVSDWQGIDQLSDDYYEAVITAMNAGIDMNMVPDDYRIFMDTLTRAVENGDIAEERIDDAVMRILSVKFELGLFENPFADPELLHLVGSNEHRQLGREAVFKSLVLLKNEDGALPISDDARVIFVGGEAADDIGIQSGGWTIEWQGDVGEITDGTTILEGIVASSPDDAIVYHEEFGQLKNIQSGDEKKIQPDVCIAVAGERPYAEGVGDSADLAMYEQDLLMLDNMENDCDELVVVLVSGRPIIITDLMDRWDAVVAAWLPGTEGQGVADVLFGDQPFSGKLPYTWPRSVGQLPFDFDDLGVGEDGPLFPYGYGVE